MKTISVVGKLYALGVVAGPLNPWARESLKMEKTSRKNSSVCCTFEESHFLHLDMVASSSGIL